jgi:hypothetical protein
MPNVHAVANLFIMFAQTIVLVSNNLIIVMNVVLFTFVVCLCRQVFYAFFPELSCWFINILIVILVCLILVDLLSVVQ